MLSPALIFEDNVALALGRWLGGDKTKRQICVLARLLGSASIVGARTPTALIQEDKASEDLASRTWLEVLRSYAPTDNNAFEVERHIVAGLLQNDRWRLLLTTEQAARAWACLVSRFFAHGASARRGDDVATISMYRDVAGDLYPALTDWLGADYLDGGCYEDRTFASVLFGDAWCVLVFDARPQHMTLAELVESTLPTFVPGVLPIDTEQAYCALPALQHQTS